MQDTTQPSITGTAPQQEGGYRVEMPRERIQPNRAQRRKWAHGVRAQVRAAKRAKAAAA